jgi:predicted glycoside hydrolase/deacetylase ChbG (UPF0249 family)
VSSSAGAATLIIAADDYGYWPSYNRGILEGVRRGVVDSVGALVEREHCDPGPLRELGVEVGLHLEFEGRWGRRSRNAAQRSLEVQLDRFSREFKGWPAYIDGHHHCHATLPIATATEDLALELRVPVRAVGEDHRFRLEERGIATPDRLVGRMHEHEPALPRLLADALDEEALPWGITEWVVHPGHSDPDSGSSYDRGREADLALLLQLANDETLVGARATHRVALGGAAA